MGQIALIGQNQELDSVNIEDILISSYGGKNTNLQSILQLDSITIATIPRMENYTMFIPGMEMQSGALNTSRISIRGIGSRSPFATSKIRVYLDDIPLTDGVGETTLEDINLATIAHIEVYKGPISALYGSALGGTLILKSDYNRISNRPLLSQSFTFGSFATWRSDTHFTKNWNDNQLTYVNLEYLRSDGFRNNNKYKKWAGTLYHKWIGENDYWSIFAQGINLNAQIPSSINIEDYHENPQLAAPNWQAVDGNESNQKLRMGISYNRAINPQNSIVLSGYSNFFSGYEIRPFNVLDDRATVMGGSLKYLLQSGKWALTLGQEIYHENYYWEIFEIIGKEAGDQLSSQESRRYLYNAYGQLNLNITEYLTGVVGINSNYTRWNLLDVYRKMKTKSNYPWQINPTFSLSWQLNKQLSNTLVIGKGFSTPSIDESLDADGQFISNLMQESGWNYELQTRYVNDENWVLSSQFFYMDISDLLVNQRDPGGETFAINAGETHMYGWESTIQYSTSISENSIFTGRANLSIGHYQFDKFVDNNNDYSSHDLTGIAPAKWTMFIEWKNKQFFVNSTARFVGATPINDANTVYSEAYFLQLLSMGKNFIYNHTKWQLTLYVENLWNTQYASMLGVNARAFGNNLPRYYYPGRERNFNIKLTLNFN